MSEKEREREYERFTNIAEFVGCDIEIVRLCFVYGLRSLGSLTPDAMAANADLYDATDRFELLVAKAKTELERLPTEVYDLLIIGGGLTVPQLEGFEELIGELKQDILDRNSRYDRRGRKNWAAHTLAHNARRLFKEIDEPITFGHLDGHPTTKFGRTVEFVLQQFGIKANWREPASKAYRQTERRY